MSYQKTKKWVPNLFPKQVEVFNCYKKFLLISGPRYTGKSIAAIHRVIRHLYEVPSAYVGVFSKTLRTAKEGGVWLDFLNIVLPEWMGREIDIETGEECYVPKVFNKLGQPFEFTTIDSKGTSGPKSDSTTRTMYFKVRNYWGGESTLLLFSLDNEAEAEQRLKSTRYSCLYFPELSNFKTNKVYTVAMNQLRMYHLKEEQHLWIADTNPDPEGEDSWIYDLFYRQRTQVDHKYPSVQKDLHLIEIFLNDNPYLTEGRRAEIEHSHSHDEGEFQRNVNGIWAKGHGKIGKVFADIFDEKLHVIPDYVDINLTSELFSGWDLGEVNNAVVMVEKRIIIKDGKEQTIWIIFQETVSINAPVSTRAFVESFLNDLQDIEQFYGKKLMFKTHYSDDSAINKFRPSSDSYDYLSVRDISGGEIELQGVYKPNGSIGARVRMIRQLLFENRLFIGSNCEHCIDAMKNMMKGQDQPIAKNSRQKHVLDAFSYIIFAESIEEMSESGAPKSRPDKLISI